MSIIEKHSTSHEEYPACRNDKTRVIRVMSHGIALPTNTNTVLHSMGQEGTVLSLSMGQGSFLLSLLI